MRLHGRVSLNVRVPMSEDLLPFSEGARRTQQGGPGNARDAVAKRAEELVKNGKGPESQIELPEWVFEALPMHAKSAGTAAHVSAPVEKDRRCNRPGEHARLAKIAPASRRRRAGQNDLCPISRLQTCASRPARNLYRGWCQGGAQAE